MNCRRSSAILPYLLVLALVASACGVADAGDMVPAEPATSAVSPITVETLPLQKYADAVSFSEAEHWASERAIQACMADAGFEYQMAPFFELDLLGVDSRYGQRLAPAGGSDEHGGVNPAYAVLDTTQRRAWDDAFFGTSTVRIDTVDGGWIERTAGGCLDTGYLTVLADIDAWQELTWRVQDLAGRSYAESERAPQVVTAMKAWSQCMRERGYVVGDLEGLQFIQGADLESAAASCSNSSGLARTWLEVESGIQKRLLATAGAELDALLAAVRPD